MAHIIRAIVKQPLTTAFFLAFRARIPSIAQILVPIHADARSLLAALHAFASAPDETDEQEGPDGVNNSRDQAD
jgi:hypothetical protein